MKRILICLALVLLISSTLCGQGAKERKRFRVPDINGRATLLVKPVYTDSEAVLEADGKTLGLKVVVDTNGNVISATCSTACPAGLRNALERAAMESKFSPLIVGGELVSYEGLLLYSIAVERMDWFKFGTALESVHNFDNISAAPVAAQLTNQWGEEKARLLAIDSEKDVNVRIRTIAEIIDHFKKKLDVKEGWIFSSAVAVRNITFWLQTDSAIDRAALQEGFARISKVAKTAPAEIPREFVDGLILVSEFKIDPEMSDRDLRKEIFKLSASTLRNYPR